MPAHADRPMHRHLVTRPDLMGSLAVVLFVVAASAHACEPTDPAWNGAMGEGTAPTWERGGSAWSPLRSISVSNYDSDCNPWLRADENEIFFIRYAGEYGPADAEHQGSWDIYHAERDLGTGEWGPATNLGPNINTSEADRRPSCTATGDTLFFTNGAQIFVAFRSGGEFTGKTPLFVGSDPCISGDNQQLYYVRASETWVCDRLGPNITSWTNHRSVGAPVNVSGSNEVRPYISRDGAQLFFSDFGSPRTGGYGDADLWVSSWTGSAWSTPTNVGPPICQDRPTCTPFLNAAGNHLYTSSESVPGTEGTEDIWISYSDFTPSAEENGASSSRWELLGDMAGAWHVHDLLEATDGSLYAATSPPGRVFRSTDDGTSWTETGALAGADVVHSLLQAANGTLFAGTYPNGDVFRSTDNGATWTNTGELPGARVVRALTQTSDGRLLAGTSPLPRVFSSTNNGITWTQLAQISGITNGITRIFEVSPNVLLAGGWGNPVRSTNGGVNWTQITLFSGMGSIEDFFRAADNSIWMCGWSHNRPGAIVYRSTDEGVSFTLTPEELHVGDIRGIRAFALTQLESGAMLAGFEPGPDSSVCTTGDNGATWVPEGALAGSRYTMCFLTREDGTLLAGTTPNGDVYRRVDGITSDTPIDPPAPLPGVTALLDNQPNPFSESTRIQFQLARAAETRLSIVDALGRRVRDLSVTSLGVGRHSMSWDGLDDGGTEVANGIYFARLQAGGDVSYLKMLRWR